MRAWRARCSTLYSARSAELAGTRQGLAHSPLILYSPVSWLLELRMLSAEDSLDDPTVFWRSKPGCAGSTADPEDPGRTFSSGTIKLPGRRAKGFRMGMMAMF
jgi:hypothetical protein